MFPKADKLFGRQQSQIHRMRWNLLHGGKGRRHGKEMRHDSSINNIGVLYAQAVCMASLKRVNFFLNGERMASYLPSAEQVLIYSIISVSAGQK